METFLHKLGVVATTIALSVSSLLGFNHAPADQNVGATIPIPVALFQTSLASSILANDTSMTLVSGTTKDGTTLNGTYGFIIDEGSATEEFVNATCVNTACTGMTRGLSVVNGTSTITTLKQTHRRGASVKITDAPQILVISRILNGNETVPNPIKYDSSVTNVAISGDARNLVNVSLLNATAFGSTPVAVSSGGTGAVTLSGVLVGNGTSPVTSTSSPYVISINTSSSTATSTFSGGLTVQNNFIASGTSTLSGTTTITANQTNRLVLNGLSYNLPSNRGSSSTALVEDGAGNLTFGNTGAYAQGQSTVTSTSTGVVGVTFAHNLGSVPRLFTLSTKSGTTNCSNVTAASSEGTATSIATQTSSALNVTNGTGAVSFSNGSNIASGHCTGGGADDTWSITTYDSTNVKITLTNNLAGMNWVFQWQAFK